MRLWERFLDSIDSSGGHLALLLALILIGCVMYRLAIPKAEDIIVGAFGALLGALKVTSSNFQRNKEVPNESEKVL